MTQAELNRQVRRLLARFDDVNTFYIEKVAAQIAEIGDLTASTMNIIAVFAAMNEDIAEINMRIAQAARATMPELHRVYERALNDLYHAQRGDRRERV